MKGEAGARMKNEMGALDACSNDDVTNFDIMIDDHSQQQPHQFDGISQIEISHHDCSPRGKKTSETVEKAKQSPVYERDTFTSMMDNQAHQQRLNYPISHLNNYAASQQSPRTARDMTVDTPVFKFNNTTTPTNPRISYVNSQPQEQLTLKQTIENYLNLAKRQQGMQANSMPQSLNTTPMQG